ncbi:2'-5' RNA ligase family protein [Pelagibius litoralis]|uniref:2'-5' RNA ligase family protein n=1 Tax=Pelagibius litoralis TaxID=374515 RepID=A0A967KFK7_9PROT|nr:2'-5' RNA ligase family protein [Pelagibius litoralis]NIA71400.1 2'-5' RNA ligase family protein [Pelagibius litoralis]
MIYVLTYPKFEIHTTQVLDQFRAQNEPERAKLVAPHLTLMFGVKGVEPQEIVTLCRDVVEAMPQFQVTLDRFEMDYDSIEKTHKIYLLCGKGREQVIALHEALYQAKYRSQLRLGIPYQPHMTVATNKDQSALKATKLSSLGELPIAGTIEKIDVVAVRSGKLRSLETVTLDG